MSVPPSPEPGADPPPRRPPVWRQTSVILRVGGAGALLVLMLATDWYGLSTPAHGSFGAAGSRAASAWSTLSVIRWWLVLAVAGSLLSVVVRHRAMTEVAALVGLIATATLFYRLLVVLPEPHAVLDVKLGGYLALLACAALTIGAYEAEPPRGPRTARRTGGASGASGRTA